MSKPKKNGVSFDLVKRLQGKDSQFLITSRFITDSPEYKRLSMSAKCVMQAMQKHHWTNKYTTVGRTQIAIDIGCDKRTVSRAWKELIAEGWLRIDKYHDHNRQLPRTWELLWMSYIGKPPKDNWREKVT